MLPELLTLLLSLTAPPALDALAEAGTRARTIAAELERQDAATAATVDREATELLSRAQAADEALATAQRDIAERHPDAFVRHLLAAERAIAEAESHGLTLSRQRARHDRLLATASSALQNGHPGP